jgi:hypothetical protein
MRGISRKFSCSGGDHTPRRNSAGNCCEFSSALCCHSRLPSASLRLRPYISPMEMMFCAVCFDELEKSAAHCPTSSICRNCLVSYVENEISEAKIHPTGSIKCYCRSDCTNQLSRGDILALLVSDDQSNTNSLVEKYHEFHRNAQVSSDPTKLWCVSPGCSGIATIATGYKHKARCDSCDLTFCSLCHEQHSSYLVPFCRGQPHSESEESVKQWKNSNSGKCKKCPKCRHHIEKNGGCNHMTCSFCKYEFCWLCKSRYESGCTAKKLCRVLALNKHHVWGQSSVSRAASKSVAYPIMTGVVGAGIGVGAALIATNLGILAVGAVTVLPCYGAKKLYKHLKSKKREARESRPSSFSLDDSDRDLGPDRVMRHGRKALPRRSFELDHPSRSSFSSSSSSSSAQSFKVDDEPELGANLSDSLSVGILFVDDLLADIDMTDLAPLPFPATATASSV